MRLPTSIAFVYLWFLSSAFFPGSTGQNQDENSTPYSVVFNVDKFNSATATGLWLVKHHSPFCVFCLELAPTWKELAEKKSKEYPGLMHFGEVDCVATGDLCVANNVSAFPELQWWVGGKKVTIYPIAEPRDLDTLSKHVDAQITAYLKGEDLAATATKVKPQEIPNPSGISVPLNFESFNEHISLTHSKSTGPGWFVKFYVPWCTHCKHMANAWKEMAREMKGKLNIGEVNCDVEPKLCNDIKLRGYPGLIFFKGGEKVEYDGLRGLGDLISYAGKAVQAGVHEITSQEFDIYEKVEEVMFLYFYDQATTSEDFEALERTSLNLIGHAPLFKTNSEALITRFRIPSFPKLIVLRDGKVSYYNALSPREMRDHRRLLSWMKSVWLPMVPELSAANSHEVMQGRTVVLAILDRTAKDFEQIKQKVKTAAVEWLDVRAGEDKAEKQELREQKESKIEKAEERGNKKEIEKAKGIQVVVKPKKEVGFAWVDGVFWGHWCRGTYGVDVRETGWRIIINEQDEKRFWDVNLQGKPIQATPESIIETLQAVLVSPPKITPVSTVGRLETMYRACVAFIRTYPFGLFGIVLFVVLAAALWVRRRMRRKFGASLGMLHEKRWGEGNGSETNARQSSGGRMAKFD